MFSFKDCNSFAELLPSSTLILTKEGVTERITASRTEHRKENPIARSK